MMMRRGTFGSKDGVTLVELLVVMLIVVILAVSLVPFLRDYIVRARYTAEGVPVIGDLRTKVELHRYEPGGLPGLNSADDGIDGFIDTTLDATGSGSGHVQTWILDNTITNATAQYGKAVMTGLGTIAKIAATEADHFGGDLSVESQHLTGRRMRPNHLFYTGIQSSNGTSYAYALGVFGDGNQGLLNASSGYAVLEVYNAAQNMKLVAEWSKFVERGSDGSQIALVDGVLVAPTDYNAAGGREQLEDFGRCHVGSLTALLDPEADVVNAQLNFLEGAGWEFSRE
jgi:prepilin-type N-terminal cleavage/methylation domain-containing protein